MAQWYKVQPRSQPRFRGLSSSRKKRVPAVNKGHVNEACVTYMKLVLTRYTIILKSNENKKKYHLTKVGK